MAEGHTTGGPELRKQTDIRQNVEMWHLFTRMTLWITASVVVIVALLGYFLTP
jgi:hypothetical protein